MQLHTCIYNNICCCCISLQHDIDQLLTVTVAITFPELPTSLTSGSRTVVKDTPVSSSTTTWVTAKLMNPFTDPFWDKTGVQLKRRRRKKRGAARKTQQPVKDNTERKNRERNNTEKK